MRNLLVLALSAALLAAADEARRVDALFQAYAGAGTPGCAVGVARDGRTLLAKGYGVGDLEHGIRLSGDSVFYMASVSKQFMAYATLLLEKEGKLALTDPVGKHVPGLPEHTAQIPLRHLLQHTSGIRDYLALGEVMGFLSDHVWTERTAFELVARQRATNFAPGAEYLYSNSGYLLLALAAQREIGGKLNPWMQARVFGPLGMNATRWQHDHRDPVPGRAYGYVQEQGAWKISNSMLDTVGGGGLYSSVNDMMRWVRRFDEGDALIERMSQTGSLASGKPIPNGYGMGLTRSKYRGLTLISHLGSLAGYRTFLFRLPGKKFSVVCLCNNADALPARLAGQVADVWMEREYTEPAAPADNRPASSGGRSVDAMRAAKVAGDWWSDELLTLYRFRARDGKLWLEVNDRGPMEVTQLPDGKLSWSVGGTTFEQPNDASLVLAAGRVRGITLRRLLGKTE